MRLPLSALLLTVGLGLPLAPVAAAAAEPGSIVDFDGDGGADVAVGAPGEDVGETVGAGSVAVFFSSERTPVLLSQASPGVPGSPETGDGFGGTLAVGNFNSDAYSDLAVGVPGEALAGAGTVGLVQVFRARDRFGSAVGTGDLDGDGRADLAVGVPGEAIGSRLRAGAVVVLKAGPGGLSGTGSRFLSQDTPGAGGTAESGDLLGAAVAVVDGDLVAGAPGEAVGSEQEAGALNVFVGTPTGLSGGPYLDEPRAGLSDALAGEAFGAAVVG